MTGMDNSSCGESSRTSAPFSSRRTGCDFAPRNTRVSMGSRSGSMGGLVTCEALMRIRSQYTGSGLGLPMDERRTPPLAACLYISLTVSLCQFAFSRRLQSLLTIFRALVGHRATHL